MVYFYPWSNQLIPDFKKSAAPDPIELPAIHPMIPPMMVPAAMPMGPPKVPMAAPCGNADDTSEGVVGCSVSGGSRLTGGLISLADIVRLPCQRLPVRSSASRRRRSSRFASW